MRGPVMHAVIFWLALLLLPLSVQAQDFDCAALDAPPLASTVAPRDRLNALEQNGCLGGSNDRAALTHEIVNALPDGRAPRSPGVSDDARRAAPLSALARIAAAIERQFVGLPAHATPAANATARLAPRHTRSPTTSCATRNWSSVRSPTTRRPSSTRITAPRRYAIASGAPISTRRCFNIPGNSSSTAGGSADTTRARATRRATVSAFSRRPPRSGSCFIPMSASNI